MRQVRTANKINSSKATSNQPYVSAIAVERAADILFKLAEDNGSSVSELARHLGIGLSTVHRILIALLRRGLVEQDPDTERYRLTWRMVALARSGHKQDDVREIALPFMRQLCELTGETITLTVRSGFERVCIEQVESPQEVRWHTEIGRIEPLYAGATGKLLLAYMADKQRKQYFATFSPRKLTPYTTIGARSLEEECQLIRDRGYAIGSQDHVIGTAGIATPIFRRGGGVIAAVGIGAPAMRCSVQQLETWATALVACSQAISAQLGSGTF
jgi:IclR family KDG regulon transcriptional repressor